jgi:large subunit ribosomal protein L28
MSSGMKCFLCGKGIMVGHNVSHAKNRTRKVFKPNLHSARISVNGSSMKVRLCTKCLREVKGKNKRSLKLAEKEAAKNVEISTIAPVASGLA